MKYFGTDGFRGEAGKALTADHAYKIGRYLGWYYNQDHKGSIVIGKDTRRSSYMFEYALVSGIIASGSNAYLLHVTTTPSVAYVARTEDFDCGVMISASHNPFYDNGIKIMDANGHKMAAKVEENIEKYIDGEMAELPFASGEDIGIATDYAIGRVPIAASGSGWTARTARLLPLPKAFLTRWERGPMSSTMSRTA